MRMSATNVLSCAAAGFQLQHCVTIWGLAVAVKGCAINAAEGAQTMLLYSLRSRNLLLWLLVD